LRFWAPEVTDAEGRFGDSVHRLLDDAFVFDKAGWPRDMADEVERAINMVRFARPVQVHIIWLNKANAFAVPGYHVYVSRELLSRGLNVDGLAFVVGHEVAHLDLGHLERGRWLLDRLGGLAFRSPSLMVAALANATALAPRAVEREADIYGAALATEAGFRAEGALEAFDVLRRYLLDFGDVDGVVLDDHEKARGLHPPLQERAATLRRFLALDASTHSSAKAA
jgi:predicted Zn-dependent protease